MVLVGRGEQLGQPPPVCLSALRAVTGQGEQQVVVVRDHGDRNLAGACDVGVGAGRPPQRSVATAAGSSRSGSGVTDSQGWRLTMGGRLTQTNHKVRMVRS